MAVETFYCSCGASWRVSWRTKHEPPVMVAVREIRNEHLHDGHSEVNARECAAARRRAERAWVKS